MYVFGSSRVDAEPEESEIICDDPHFTEEFDYTTGKRCPCLLILDSTYFAFYILALGFAMLLLESAIPSNALPVYFQAHYIAMIPS